MRVEFKLFTPSCSELCNKDPPFTQFVKIHPNVSGCAFPTRLVPRRKKSRQVIILSEVIAKDSTERKAAMGRPTTLLQPQPPFGVRLFPPKISLAYISVLGCCLSKETA
jgi:hypothetical protein